MRRRCPACGRNPGDGSTCDECGAPVYRYAVESDEWAAANPDFDDAWDIDPDDLDLGDVDIPPPDPDLVPPPPVPTPSLPPSGARPPIRRTPERPTQPQPAPASDQTARRPSGCRGCLVVVLIIAVVGGALALFASLLVGGGTVDFETGGGAAAEVTLAGPGECLDLVVDGTVGVDTVAVPCEEPHDAEAFQRVLLPAGPFPGDTAVADEADAACLEDFEGYVGAAYAESEYWLDSVVPTEAGWSGGDREIVCLLVSGDGSPLVGSGYQSGR
jgi:hypothetical protein